MAEIDLVWTWYLVTDFAKVQAGMRQARQLVAVLTRSGELLFDSYDAVEVTHGSCQHSVVQLWIATCNHVVTDQAHCHSGVIALLNVM